MDPRFPPGVFFFCVSGVGLMGGFARQTWSDQGHSDRHRERSDGDGGLDPAAGECPAASTRTSRAGGSERDVVVFFRRRAEVGRIAALV